MHLIHLTYRTSQLSPATLHGLRMLPLAHSWAIILSFSSRVIASSSSSSSHQKQRDRWVSYRRDGMWKHRIQWKTPTTQDTRGAMVHACGPHGLGAVAPGRCPASASTVPPIASSGKDQNSHFEVYFLLSKYPKSNHRKLGTICITGQ